MSYRRAFDVTLVLVSEGYPDISELLNLMMANKLEYHGEYITPGQDGGKPIIYVQEKQEPEK